MNSGYFLKVFPKLLERAPLSIGVVIVVYLLSLLFASLMTVVRIQKIPVLHQLLGAFISFMRSTPGTIHLFIVYYGLPILFAKFHLHLDGLSKVGFCIISMTLYFSAYMTEILRPGYLSIPRGQKEAAQSIGMTTWQLNRRIIIPQVIPVVLPSLGNALMDAIKYTSLLFLIGVKDIMGQAEILNTNSYGLYEMEIYFAVGLVYWGISVLLHQVLTWIEKRSTRYIYEEAL